MMWFLAYHMEMSTVPAREVEALTDDIGDDVTLLEYPDEEELEPAR